MKLHAAVHAAEGCRVTAGDEYLPVMDMIENIILPGRVELTHHIVQKRNRLFTRDVPEQGSPLRVSEQERPSAAVPETHMS